MRLNRCLSASFVVDLKFTDVFMCWPEFAILVQIGKGIQMSDDVTFKEYADAKGVSLDEIHSLVQSGELGFSVNSKGIKTIYAPDLRKPTEQELSPTRPFAVSNAPDNKDVPIDRGGVMLTANRVDKLRFFGGWLSKDVHSQIAARVEIANKKGWKVHQLVNRTYDGGAPFFGWLISILTLGAFTLGGSIIIIFERIES